MDSTKESNFDFKTQKDELSHWQNLPQKKYHMQIFESISVFFVFNAKAKCRIWIKTIPHSNAEGMNANMLYANIMHTQRRRKFAFSSIILKCIVSYNIWINLCMLYVCYWMLFPWYCSMAFSLYSSPFHTLSLSRFLDLSLSLSRLFDPYLWTPHRQSYVNPLQQIFVCQHVHVIRTVFQMKI